MTTFAENTVVYPDTQTNVETPPATLFQNGFLPKQNGVRGQPLVANWLNWFFRDIYRKIGQGWLDGAGTNAITTIQQDSMIVLYAVVKTDPSKYIHAVGYKTGSGIPVFQVLNNATLTIGTVTANNIQILGAAANTIALRVTVTGQN